MLGASNCVSATTLHIEEAKREAIGEEQSQCFGNLLGQSLVSEYPDLTALLPVHPLPVSLIGHAQSEAKEEEPIDVELKVICAYSAQSMETRNGE